MKKALIAGAASVALAAMPVVGVFATGTAKESLTDRFQFNIAHECSFNRVIEESNGGHPTGSWTAANGTGAAGTDSDKIAITLTAGNTGSLGQSKFNVTCNGSHGYQVKAYVTNLTTGADTITAGSTPVAASATSWTAQSSSTSGYVTATTSGTANTVASSSTPTVNAGQDFTMTYAVGLANGQASGTYLGNIVYTLVDLTPAAEQQ